MLSKQGSNEVKRLALLCAVHVSTYLRFVVVVVAGPCWYLYVCDMGMLSYVGGPLLGNPSLLDALHKFKLRDVPIVDGVLFLSTSGLKLEHNILVHVKFTQNGRDKVDVVIVDMVGLNLILEVHECPNCDDKARRCRSADHAHNAMLNVAMQMAHDLFGFDNTALVVTRPGYGL